ncbi:hypothetical protein [Streptomyces sp. AK02-04a]|uniref:hypothetical protein n=1 Tax=Streptomyces sp. AK02-04a TaxID=3028649 RepID=UPI0029AF4B4A|nr:hypothetical protein [Streptomyces sp. AK02-04a]MDX3763934.1 hypothetical protein [Streptomyces sp. AK02-04a]
MAPVFSVCGGSVLTDVVAQLYKAAVGPLNSLRAPTPLAQRCYRVTRSLHLALLASPPQGGALVADLAETAVEHYALGYSKHSPHILFTGVRDVRKLLPPALESGEATDGVRRQVGWLSALLGNLAFHLDGIRGARAHLDTAAAYVTEAGDRRLEAWAWGGAEHGGPDLRPHRDRPRARGAGSLRRAARPCPRPPPRVGPAARPRGRRPGRRRRARPHHRIERTRRGRRTFGFDAAELALHQAEAYLVLERASDARTRAEPSVA